MPEAVVIDFDGGIEDFPLLVQAVDNLIASGVRRVAIDLSRLALLNSAALGYLIATRQRLEHEGGSLALCRVQPAIRRVLELSGLDDALPAFETEAEALGYLGAASSSRSRTGRAASGPRPGPASGG